MRFSRFSAKLSDNQMNKFHLGIWLLTTKMLLLPWCTVWFMLLAAMLRVNV